MSKQGSNNDYTLYKMWIKTWEGKENAKFPEKPNGYVPTFDYFFDQQYNEAVSKADFHRDENFKVKKRIVGIIMCSAIPQLALIVSVIIPRFYKAVFDNKIKTALGVEVLLLILLALVVIAFSKHLDVNKHQETWARNRLTQLRYEREMVAYLEGLLAYSGKNDAEKKEIFKKHILNIDKSNNLMFAQNLINNEAKMTEDIEKIVQAIK